MLQILSVAPQTKLIQILTTEKLITLEPSFDGFSIVGKSIQIQGGYGKHEKDSLKRSMSQTKIF